VIVTQSNAALPLFSRRQELFRLSWRVWVILLRAASSLAWRDRVATLPGSQIRAEQFAGKWVQLLREAVPKSSRIAVLAISQTSSHRTYWTEIQATAQSLKIIPQRHGDLTD
jgi:hypothetical protein